MHPSLRRGTIALSIASVATLSLTACGMMPGQTPGRSVSGVNQAISPQVSDLINQARTPASHGDRTATINLLQQAQAALQQGRATLSADSPDGRLARQLMSAIEQIQAANVNPKEVSTILVQQLHDSLVHLQQEAKTNQK